MFLPCVFSLIFLGTSQRLHPDKQGKLCCLLVSTESHWKPRNNRSSQTAEEKQTAIQAGSFVRILLTMLFLVFAEVRRLAFSFDDLVHLDPDLMSGYSSCGYSSSLILALRVPWVSRCRYPNSSRCSSAGKLLLHMSSDRTRAYKWIWALCRESTR